MSKRAQWIIRRYIAETRAQFERETGKNARIHGAEYADWRANFKLEPEVIQALTELFPEDCYEVFDRLLEIVDGDRSLTGDPP